MTSRIAVVHIGLDIGGTKTAVAWQVADSDRIRRFATHGANLKNAGIERTAGVIGAAVERIKAEAGADVEPHAVVAVRVVAGVAGAGREPDRASLEELLSGVRSGDEDSYSVTSDARIAIEAAFSGEDGIVVIAGTGSGVYALDADGNEVRAGGWGPALGDPASGTSLGLQGLRAVARMLDGGPGTDLAELLKKEYRERIGESPADGLRLHALEAARVAPLVLRAAAGGDRICGKIVQRETDELAREASWVAQRAGVRRAAIVGGLTRSDYFTEFLEARLREHIDGLELKPPDAPPEIGALRLCAGRT